MERRHLIARAEALAAPGLAAPAIARASRRVLVDGPPAGPAPSTPSGYLGLDREGTGRLSARRGGGVASQLDGAENAAVASFGEFGCKDPLIRVSALSRQGSSPLLKLVQEQPAPGTAHRRAIFPTYPLFAVPRASLGKPYPTRAPVSVARS